MGEWYSVALDQTAWITKGRLLTTTTSQSESGMLYLGASDLEGTNWHSERSSHLPVVHPQPVWRYGRNELALYASGEDAVICNEADVLMLWDGERSGLVGCGLAGAVGSTVARIRPIQSKVIGRYLYHHLSNRYEEIQSLRTGTGVPHVARDLPKILKVPVPLLEEQQRIAEILDTVDEAIHATERVISKLRTIRNGILFDVLDTYFPGSGPISLRASRSTTECIVLSALVENREIKLGRGKVISSIDIADDPGPYPIYSSSASATGEFGKYGKFMFDEELITWSVDGGGRPFHRPRHRFSVTNVCGFLRIQANQHWSYRFVHAIMEAQHAQLTFDWLMKAHPSVIRDLYWLPRIPLNEQLQIVKFLDAADTSIQREKTKLEKLRKLRSGLADDLLSGRVRTVAV